MFFLFIVLMLCPRHLHDDGWHVGSAAIMGGAVGGLRVLLLSLAATSRCCCGGSSLTKILGKDGKNAQKKRNSSQGKKTRNSKKKQGKEGQGKPISFAHCRSSWSKMANNGRDSIQGRRSDHPELSPGEEFAGLERLGLAPKVLQSLWVLQSLFTM